MSGTPASTPIDRRRFLTASAAVGAACLTGGRLAPLARAASGPPAGRAARARSIIHVFLPGGIAQQESFDPKPYAPSEYRGPFGAIATKLDGVQFSEVFPRMAKLADRLTICRATTHGEAAHERGQHNMLTGYRPSPALVYPSMGSVVAHELGPQNDLPPYVCIPDAPNEYAGPGYLSAAYGPFSLGSDPGDRRFRVRDLAPPEQVGEARFARRRELLDVVDAEFADRAGSDAVAAMESFYERAYALIDSASARDAFDLGAEDPKLRDRYGRNAAGQRFLLARRLVEAGVRYVTVTVGSFDHHVNLARSMRAEAPPVDVAFANLIEDLDARGRLDETLVLLTSDFGRSPKVNDTDGRDHWPRVFTTVLAGGGVKRGHAHGTSDARAAEPEEDALSIADLAMTVFHLIGIDGEKELIAPGNRPIEVVKGGRVIEDLLA